MSATDRCRRERGRQPVYVVLGWAACALLACHEGRPDVFDAGLLVADAARHTPEGFWDGGTADCGGEAERFAVGAEMGTASAGYAVQIVDATPEVLGLGSHTWRVRVLNAEPREVSGAALSLTPWMPSHGHGTPRRAVTREIGAGLYEITPVHINMPGLWEFRLRFETADGDVGQVTFAFCVPS